MGVGPTGLQRANSATRAMCAMAIAIDIVSNLTVVHNLAMSSVDPVEVACAGFLTVWAISWTCGGGVLEGAVQPVNASITHADDLVLPSQACMKQGRLACAHARLQNT